MATQTAIPPDLTDDDKAAVFQDLDGMLNSGILYALLHGLYTGTLAVTLWNIFVTNKCWHIRRALAIVIILLHALITINFAVNMSYIRSAFIENGQNFWTVFLKLAGAGQAVFWESGISASLSTLLTGLYMIWCCWMVWGQRWYIGLLPMLSLVSAIVSRIMQTYYTYYANIDAQSAQARRYLFTRLYLSLNLVTTLSCTLLIIYRITVVAGVRRGTGCRLRVYRRFIGVLVAALYSIALILYLALFIHEDYGSFYLDAIGAIAKGVVPTLLVGRAAAGHTRPNDTSDESTVSALHFRMAPSEPVITSLRESAMQRTVLKMDIEAQSEQSDELVVVVVCRKECKEPHNEQLDRSG